MDSIYHFIQRKEIQTLILMGIRGVSLVSKFALTLFIARFMGFEVLGLYGLILSATFIVPAIAGLGIMYMKIRNSVTQKPKEIVKILYEYARYILLVYAVLIIVTSIAGYYQGDIYLAFLILFVIFFEHINNEFYTLLLNRSKPLSANILHFMRTSVWILLFMGTVFIYPSLQEIEVLLLGWTIGGALSFLGFFWVTRVWPWKKCFILPPFKAWIKEEFSASRTIYLNNIMDTSSQYLNHFLITFFLGLELTGVYVYFMQIINAMSNLLRTGIIQTTRPKFVLACKNGDDLLQSLYRTCLKHTVLVAVLMSFVAIPAMYFVTIYVVDRPLAMEWYGVFLVSLVFFSLLMATEVRDMVLYSYHRDDLLFKLNFLSISTLLLLTFIFIPLFGLWGAAITLLVMISLKLFMQQKLVYQLMRGDK